MPCQANSVGKLLIAIGPFCEADAEPICSWVRTPEQLRMIAGDTANGLNRRILHRWVDESIDPVTLRYRDHAVGFCTLSEAEHHYPRGHVEVCHVIIAPKYRRRYLGTALLSYMRALAAERGFQFLHGRVVPENRAGLLFFNYLHWTPEKSNHLPRGFSWFVYELRSLEAANRLP